jgi:hypothetical protein
VTKFIVTIECNNDAFVDDPNAEVARILHKIADRLTAADEIAGRVNDVNGNRVGTFAYEGWAQ